MSVRPTLETIIGISPTAEQKELFKTFSEENAFESVAELLKDDPLLSQDVEFPIPVHKLLMTLEEVCNDPQKGNVIGFRPFHHEEEAFLHDHLLVWSLLESGVLPEEGFEKKIPYMDYGHAIGASVEELLELPLSIRMEMKHYEGKWARKYFHSPLNYFDEELRVSLALFKRMGIELEPKQIERWVILSWG